MNCETPTLNKGLGIFIGGSFIRRGFAKSVFLIKESDGENRRRDEKNITCRQLIFNLLFVVREIGYL